MDNWLIVLAVTTAGGIFGAMVFTLWQERQHRSEIGNVKAGLTIRIVELERRLVEERRAREADARTAQVRLDFLMDYVRDRDQAPLGRGETVAASAEIDIFRTLSDQFSTDEMQAVALELGIEWQNVPGDTLDTKAANLLKAAKRHNRLSQLAAIIKRERP